MLVHLTRATRHLLFWSLLALAITFTGLRLWFTEITHYKQLITKQLSQQLGTPLSIGKLSARLHGFTPELIISDIRVDSLITPTQAALTVKEIHLGIEWLGLLSSSDWLASLWINVIGAKCSLQQQNGRWLIVGLKTGDDSPPLWLLQGLHYQLLYSELTWLTAQDSITTKIDATVTNTANRHLINTLLTVVSAQQNPTSNNDTLRLSADIAGDIFANTANGTAFIEIKNWQLAHWATLLTSYNALPFELNKGIINGKLWANLQQSQINAITGEARLQQLQLSRTDKQTLSIEQFSTQFNAQQFNQHWQLQATDLVLQTDNNSSFDGAVSLSTEQDNSPTIALSIKQAALADLSKLTSFFAPAHQATWLAQAQPKGDLKNLTAFIQVNQTKPANSLFAINGAVHDFSINSSPLLPLGISKLNAYLKASEQGGQLELNAKNTQVDAPQLYANALTIEQLAAKLKWRQHSDSWYLASDYLQLKLAGLQTNSRIRLNLPKNQQSPFLDLQIALSSDDVSQLRHYFPAKIMNPDDVAWLTPAFVKGQISQGGVLYYGKLSDYPFANQAGVFEARLEVEQGALNYAPDWPVISDINAEVLFLGDQLQVNGHTGQSGGLHVDDAVVIQPHIGKSKTLSIDGKVSGSVAQTLGYLQQTPLRARVEALSNAIIPQGDTQVAFNILLPLTEGINPKVDGFAQLHQAKLTVKALDLLVSRIDGKLNFNENGIYTEQLHGFALAHPIDVSIKNANEQTQIKVLGRAGIKDLEQQFPLPWWSVATGSTDYQLNLDLPHAGEIPQLRVSSQLTGVALDLPDGLAKTANQQQPLAVTFSLNGEDDLPIQLNYAQQLKAAISLNIPSQKLRSGHLVIGDAELSHHNETGFSLELSDKDLTLDEWLTMLLNAKSHSDEQNNGINHIHIHSPHAHWQKQDLGAFDLNLHRQGEHWLGTIASPAATGNFKIPADCHDKQGIQLSMDSIDLAALKQLGNFSNKTKDDSIPTTIPLLNLSSEHTYWHKLLLGKLSLNTQRSPHGIKLQTLNLIHNDASLNLTGEWQYQSPLHSITNLQGHLHSNNTGQLLRKLGISKDLSDSKADLNFSLQWLTSPQHLNLNTMQGYADLHLNHGRILSIEPGFGRILGILAVAQWTKRLQLDFSDLYMQGLSFNSIHGHFDIAGGIAATNDFTIDAIPAKITITGTTDLTNQTLDQLINVAPKSADAVPIAGTLLGKISSVFSETLTGKNHDELFFGSQYRALGTWKNTQIIPLHENDGLLQKTWSGISRFPWMGRTNKPTP
ncbi:MAG: YhdP family protein [Methylococcaceae bacterium]